MNAPSTTNSITRLFALATLLLCAMASPSRAQTASFDGRSFDGVDLPVAPQDHALDMTAARAWTWKERGVTRLILDRDVRVNIGPYAFSARRASVWIEPIELRLPGGETLNAEQIAVFFESVRDPIRSGAVSMDADTLLVTARLTGGPPTMRLDRLWRNRPGEGELDGFPARANDRLARHLYRITNNDVPLALLSDRERRRLELERDLAASGLAGSGVDAADPDAFAVAPTGEIAPGTQRPPGARRSPDMPPTRETWIAPPDGAGQWPSGVGRARVLEPREGVVTLVSEEIEVVEREPGRYAIMLQGGIAVQVQSVTEINAAQLRGERAVVFLGDDADPRRFQYGADDIEGVYVEGDVVVTDGRFTLRGTRVYYDVRTQRAVVLDAVFWTYDARRGMPLYMRAEEIRQESLSQWSAQNVTLANVAFAEPHFSIGATDVTITRESRAIQGDPLADDSRTLVDARGVEFRVGTTPVLGLPSVRGEPRPSPLRGLRVGNDNGSAVIGTEWDLYTLLGVDRRPGERAELLIDGYIERGVGIGTEIGWDDQDGRGELFAYWIFDNGTDEFTSGAEIDRDGEHRAIVTAEQVFRIDETWTLFLEGSYISDEAFVDAFFEDLAETRREFTNSVYIRALDRNAIFSAEVRGSFNDFTPNEYLLQSLGYQTAKLPEVRYSRFGDDLFGGLISYSSEYRVGAARAQLNEPDVNRFGFDTARRSQSAFGIAPNTNIADALRAQGVDEDVRLRADTRQEIEVPLTWGPVNIVPFAAGRVTAYDEGFEDFGGRDDDDNVRFWGGAGVRTSTTFVRVDDSVESEFFDLHRVRHIIEPSVTFWTAGTSIEQDDLFIYDDEVESVADGTSVRAGVRQTWQTKRGGPGRWRSVDWLVLDVNYVWSSDETPRDSPFGSFNDARPELSNLGEFVTAEGVLNLTDAVTVAGSIIYDVDQELFPRGTAGLLIDHGFGFSSFVEYRSLDAPRASLLDAGARYELTRKYAVSLFGTIDFTEDEFQGVGARLIRRFPQWTLDVGFDVDNITEDLSFSISLRPVGFSGEERRRQFLEPQFGRGTGPSAGELDASRVTRGRFNSGPFADR
ncbi:MAG: LPS assembly protein LptD [Planctomycetota bacterium]